MIFVTGLLLATTELADSGEDSAPVWVEVRRLITQSNDLWFPQAGVVVGVLGLDAVEFGADWALNTSGLNWNRSNIVISCKFIAGNRQTAIALLVYT